MDLIPHPNKRFLPKYDRFEPVVQDSTAARCAFVCKRKYFYKIVLGFKSKRTSAPLEFGSAYHLFREELEKSCMNQVASLDQVNNAMDKAVALWKKSNAQEPVGARYDFLTTERLVASCFKANAHRDAEIKTGKIKVLATEQNFTVELRDGSKVGGRADQIISWNGRPYGRDFKTTSILGKYYIRKLEPNDQFSRYTFGESKLTGETVWGQFVEVLYNTKKEGPTIENFITNRTDYQIKTWENELIFYNENILKNCRDADIWPMESSDESCPRCEFRSVCNSISEAGIMSKLEAEFVQRPWDFSAKEDEGGAAEE